MNKTSILFSAAGIVLAWASPALADVKEGVDAWARGDDQAAVAQWQAPAAAGDPDAMFNLGQAYRLGRGVAMDVDRAEYYYSRAATLGHIQAADIYGLILFQKGQQESALPYVQDAARRGDPRSAYLLGIACFNGDLVPRDWVRAYALLTLANGQGLPQAAAAIAEMDRHIPIAQRQQGASLAVELQREADAARARELASADLALTGPGGDSPAITAATPRIPNPIASTPIDPSTADARAALRDAVLANGAESPGEAGADYARPAASPPRQAAAPVRSAPAQPPQKVTAQAAKPAAAALQKPPATAGNGPWKLQLGAFGVVGNAEKLWASLRGRPELAGKKRLLVPGGGLTRLLAEGFTSQAEAAAACSRLKQAGQSCLVTTK